MATEGTCPDCGKPLGTNPPTQTGCCYLHLLSENDVMFSVHTRACQAATIARLRAELAALHDLVGQVRKGQCSCHGDEDGCKCNCDFDECGCFADLKRERERLRAELEAERELSASLRKFRTPRATVGPFENSQLKSRPILLETDDAALQQLRDLVNALGNWYDFSAFNEVALASARELSEALGWVLDRSPHVGITAPGGHVNCWTAQMDCGREKVYADGSTMVDALLALRAKKAGE